MKTIPIRGVAWIWLSISGAAAAISSLHRDRIETHHLERALAPGFDAFGRSCMELVALSAGQSVRLMIPVAFVCILFSLTLSSVALLRSSRLEFLLRALLDFLSALPGFLIALAFGIFLRDASGTFLLGALLLAAPTLTRFFESQLRHLRLEPYIQASEALGAGPLHLWIRHYQPELIRMLRAILPFLALRLILLETSLSFLGLQQVPEHETWGRMLHQGKDYLLEAPWILYWSAIPLALTLTSFHLLSREDPH
jgi:peptide/nickel transport system permease protein